MEWIVPAMFWLSVAWIVYANVGYLVLLSLLGHFVHHSHGSVEWPDGAPLPRISLVIAAYNEEQVIARKLDNALALDYPPERLEIVVASDGSTDGTEAVVKSYSAKGVQLRAVAPRRGKVATLNATVLSAQGEILVFSDADSTYRPEVLRKLVSQFADPQVGAVTGEEVRVQETGSGKGLGESLYVRLDNRIKRLEGEINSMVMVNGGFFAIRKELYPAIRENLTHDATVPCHLFLKGYRTAYEPKAVSVEDYPLTTVEDFRRRLRTISRAFYSYLSVLAALNPFRTGLFAFQVLSHRFVRWLVFPFLLVALVTNISLAPSGFLYAVALGCQIAFYLLALTGFLLDVGWGKRWKLFYVPYYFTYIFVAAFVAVLMALLGKRISSWEPTRRIVGRFGGVA
jgi:cellulose synthase/poly-beta-1,6-N-acetylglucosamine synthase-like glycosyltransferase